MKSIFGFTIVCCFALIQCTTRNDKHVERAFYYWKSNDDYNESYYFDDLKELKVKRLYIKLFEVDYSEVRGNYPFNKVEISDRKDILKDSIEVIPTIFIKNGIFQYNDENSLNKLADNICHLITKRMNKSSEYDNNLKTALRFTEIQIDCDWTMFRPPKQSDEVTHKKM